MGIANIIELSEVYYGNGPLQRKKSYKIKVYMQEFFLKINLFIYLFIYLF